MDQRLEKYRDDLLEEIEAQMREAVKQAFGEITPVVEVTIKLCAKEAAVMILIQKIGQLEAE